jgi:hydroxymethylglutaryl-CoA lyase
MGSSLPPRAVIREVGLRDGLQSIATILPTARKLEWVRDAYAAGQREIEVGSFVPPRLLPQLADTPELVSFAKTLPGLLVSVLVPNLKGAERAIDAEADVLLVPLSASHAHSLANLRKTPDEVIAEFARIRAARDSAGSKTLLEVSIADTVGYADPGAVRDLFEQARAIAGERFWCGHFHDTRGLALANVYAAMETGVARFDATLAGIGGCPHAPGASGNASSEDLAFMLASMGIDTGIDLAKLLALRAKVADWLAGEALHGTLWRAGLPKTFDRSAASAATA